MKRGTFLQENLCRTLKHRILLLYILSNLKHENLFLYNYKINLKAQFPLEEWVKSY